MKNIIRAFVLGVASVVVFASVLVHPSGSVKAVKSAQPLFAGTDIDPVVLGVIERSCQNCHSEKTEWPWYSHIAPMSWLVENDVSQARSRMNLSRWDEYALDEKRDILARVGAVVRSHQMPPARYTMIHAGAKLSPVEREQIYGWAHAERKRLKSIIPTSVGTGF
jgi:cytochrome c